MHWFVLQILALQFILARRWWSRWLHNECNLGTTLNCSVNRVKKKYVSRPGIMVSCTGSVIRCHLSELNAKIMMTPGDVCQVDDGVDKQSKRQCKQTAPALVLREYFITVSHWRATLSPLSLSLPRVRINPCNICLLASCISLRKQLVACARWGNSVLCFDFDLIMQEYKYAVPFREL